ncbi:MAG: carboxypeptidase regulatory-like domain-containing protein, partial [Thermoanaerobaculia bacterium]
IEPGHYQVRVVGPQPLQRISVRTKVDEGMTEELRMVIDPRELEITTAIGANPLPGATVSLTSVKFNWRATLTTNASGKVAAEIWQPGDYLATVKSDAVSVPFVQMATIDDVERPSLTLRLPDRRIQGKVVDADTGASLPGIQVGLESTRLDGMTTALRTTTDDTGSFLFRSVGAGKQKLVADSDQYIRPQPVVFDIAESDQSRDVNLRLKRGVETVMVLVDGHGGAVAGASVIEFASGSITGIHMTDAGGTMKVSMPAGDARVFLAIPREGSFVIARVDAAKQGSVGVATRVVVPPGVGTLDLTTRSGGGEPIPNVFFLVRFNGELLPPESLQVFERVQGLRFATDSSGSRRLQHLPAGVYEFWPVANPREARNVLSNPVANAPTSVEVRAGGNSAVLTFAGVQKSERP